MRGRAEAAERVINPSSDRFAATFSHKGRRVVFNKRPTQLPAKLQVA